MNSSKDLNDMKDKIPFEEALNKTGFGLHSFFHTALTGVIIISYGCMAFSSTIIVPASACELATTVSQQGILAATPLIGSIIGALVWGYLGDTRGRRNMLMLSLVLSIVFNTIASISVNWVMLMVLQFITTTIASGKYPLAITLLSESIPLARRNLVLLLVASVFMLTQGILAVLAMPIIPLRFSYYLPSLDIYWNSWRTVLAVYSLPGLVSLVGLLFIRESPKFLLHKGHEARALQVLKHIHNVNLTKGDFDVKGLQVEESNKSNEKPKALDQLVPLFRAPLLKYTVIMMLLFVFKQVNAFGIWLPRILDQFVSVTESGGGSGLTLCAIVDQSLLAPPNPDVVPCALNETALLYVLAVAGLQSLANLLVSLVVDRTGRRNMVIGLTLLFGGSGVLVNLAPGAVGSLVFFVIFLVGIMTLGIYTAMCVALFPTHLRAMAVSISLMGGMIATFASIQILNFMLENGKCELGFYLFASIFAASSIVAAFLPDDRVLMKKANEDNEGGTIVVKEDKH